MTTKLTKLAKDIQKTASTIDEQNEDSQVNERIEIPWPDPLGDVAFHGLVGEIVRTIEPHTESDPVTLLTNILTMYGNIVGSRPHFFVEADRHPGRLFILNVGETSKARKGSGLGQIRRLFETIDPDWVGRISTGLSSGEGLIWAVRDPIWKKMPIKEKGRITGYEDALVDEGIDDKRLLIAQSEFSSVLRILERDGNILSAIIRDTWDTGNLGTLTKNSPAKATGAHISIIAHITQQELLRYLTDVEAANGFANRFLICCVKRSKFLPFGGEIDRVDFAPILRKLMDAVEYAKGCDQIRWGEETRPLWKNIYPELSEGKPELVGALTARGEAYVTRLACLYALLDKTNRISPDHLKAALAVWDYCEASVRYIFQGKTGNHLTDEIYQALSANSEGMTRTEISDHFNRHYSSQQITTALNILTTLKKAKKEIIPTEGRPKEVWKII